MKKLFCAFALLTLSISFAGCAGGASGGSDLEPSGNVKTGGSTSVEKVITALIYQFQADHELITVDYEMNGSGDGIKNTISGLYEIGHASRELKTDGSEEGLEATPYAIDGIAIIVYPDNPVTNLTQQQVADIFTGTITNWSELGGPDGLITLVTREPGSGTRDAFNEIVGIDESKIPASANVQQSTGAVQTTVAQNSMAIGYVSFSDVDAEQVKTVPYENVTISEESLSNGQYLLKRQFYLLTKVGVTLSSAAQAFKDFVLSSQGQAIVGDASLLPIL
jgi:phosphate transport system substrate-binding protein